MLGFVPHPSLYRKLYMHYIPLVEYSPRGIILITKAKRLKEFIRRLGKKRPANSDEEAFDLVSNTLNEVEDEMSNIPYAPKKWMNDGRMYPPQQDSKRETDNKNVVRYRNKGHNTYIGKNGSIKIEEVSGNKTVLIDKEGKDKKRIDDL